MSPDRTECLARFAKAVIAHRSRDKDGAASYLRGVEERCGREVAEQQKTELLKFARSTKAVRV